MAESLITPIFLERELIRVFFNRVQDSIPIEIPEKLKFYYELDLDSLRNLLQEVFREDRIILKVLQLRF